MRENYLKFPCIFPPFEMRSSRKIFIVFFSEPKPVGRAFRGPYFPRKLMVAHIRSFPRRKSKKNEGKRENEKERLFFKEYIFMAHFLFLFSSIFWRGGDGKSR